MSSDDSKSEAGTRSLSGRLRGFFSARPPPADDKYEAGYLWEAFFTPEGEFIEQSGAAVRLMPVPMRKVYARTLDMFLKAEGTLMASKEWKARADKGEDVRAPVRLAAAAQIKNAITKLYAKVEREGVEKSVHLDSQWTAWVNAASSDPVTESVQAASSSAATAARETFVSSVATPITGAATELNLADLNNNDLHTLILGLADGLEYDRFDTVRLRSAVFGRKDYPTLNEFVTVCVTYIFVGNNAARLTNKVKSDSVGKAALGVLNKFGVVRTKVNSTTVTLARWGIAFAPAIWILRNIFESSGKLSGSGVSTTTPKVLQDVALSGVSDYIDNGDSIKDFLIKFNRALFDFKEQKSSVKTPVEERDAIALKYHGVSQSGVSNDPTLKSWSYNTKKDENALKEFYELIVNFHSKPVF